MAATLLEAGLGQLGVAPSAGQLESVRAFLAEVELWNPRAGLVNAAGDDLIVRHLFDSLGALATIRELPHERIADVGSGAGFPGIPLAIFLPDSHFTLVERSGRRCAFLRNVLAVTGLHGQVEIVEGDLGSLKERFDIVTFRAVGSLDEMLPVLSAVALPGGAIVAYKGRREVVEREVAAVFPKTTAVDGPHGDAERKSAASSEARVKIVPLDIPGLAGERTLVVVTRR